MKRIDAIIRPHSLDLFRERLTGMCVEGMTVTDVTRRSYAVRHPGFRRGARGLFGSEQAEIRRVDKQAELEGLDVPEFGMMGYPEDAVMPAESVALTTHISGRAAPYTGPGSPSESDDQANVMSENCQSRAGSSAKLATC